MKTKRLLSLLFVLLIAVSTSGCGSKKETTDGKYYDYLEDGEYYVRHADDYCEKVYFNETSFNRGSSGPGNDRIMWFTEEEFNMIPTFKQGDSLILYNTAEFGEFRFERFVDLGWSFGIRGLRETKSGRYALSTKQSDKCTMPYGDTDILLKLNNDNVIIESFGGLQLRVPDETPKEDEDTGKEDEDDENKKESVTGLITEYGTINAPKPMSIYDFIIYDGTVKHEYKFSSNIRIIGSKEIYSTYTYEYEPENEKIIQIEIPSFFHSGYYMINGFGVFRYIAEGDTYDPENVDMMNIPNEEDDKKEDATINAGVSDQQAFAEAQEGGSQKSVLQNSFSVTSAGTIKISITFTEDDEDPNYYNTTAYIQSPSGYVTQLNENSDGNLYIEYKANEIGKYTITYYNLGTKTPEVKISTK